MPNPPQYNSHGHDSDTVELSPLMKTNQSSYDIDLEAQVTSEGKPVEVTFTFEPRYPIIGERQDVIGLLGKTKQGSLILPFIRLYLHPLYYHSLQASTETDIDRRLQRSFSKLSLHSQNTPLTASNSSRPYLWIGAATLLGMDGEQS